MKQKRYKLILAFFLQNFIVYIISKNFSVFLTKSKISNRLKNIIFTLELKANYANRLYSV